MTDLNDKFEDWYRRTHWMSPEIKRNNSSYENEVVQAMFIAYRAGYNKSNKDRKEELKVNI